MCKDRWSLSILPAVTCGSALGKPCSRWFGTHLNILLSSKHPWSILESGGSLSRCDQPIHIRRYYPHRFDQRYCHQHNLFLPNPCAPWSITDPSVEVPKALHRCRSTAHRVGSPPHHLRNHVRSSQLMLSQGNDRCLRNPLSAFLRLFVSLLLVYCRSRLY